MDIFQTQLLGIIAKSRCLIKTLRVDRSNKFILIKLKVYYQQQNIIIKYTTYYLYKKNGLIKRRQKIFVTMKDTLLLIITYLTNFGLKLRKQPITFEIAYLQRLRATENLF